MAPRKVRARSSVCAASARLNAMVSCAPSASSVITPRPWRGSRLSSPSTACHSASTDAPASGNAGREISKRVGSPAGNGRCVASTSLTVITTAGPACGLPSPAAAGGAVDPRMQPNTNTAMASGVDQVTRSSLVERLQLQSPVPLGPAAGRSRQQGYRRTRYASGATATYLRRVAPRRTRRVCRADRPPTPRSSGSRRRRCRCSPRNSE